MVTEYAARMGLKELGMNDWTINSMMELHAIVRGGHASNLSSAAARLNWDTRILFAIRKIMRISLSSLWQILLLNSIPYFNLLNSIPSPLQSEWGIKE